MEREKFRRILDDYFTFTRSERRGMLIWCTLLLLAIVLRILSGQIHLREPDNRVLFDGWPEDLQPEKGKEGIPVKQMVDFNPNTLSDAALDSLGIPGKVIANLKRYRQKGGVFRKPEDFRKLYGMTDSLFNVVKPYIRLESDGPPESSKSIHRPAARREEEKVIVRAPAVPAGRYFTRPEVVVIELNAADSAALVQLPGIGPVFAGRIVKYRNLLGGFCTPDQLGEVYGMTGERMEGLKERVKVDTSLVVPIRINFAGYPQLSRHPYIRGKLAGKIIDWRSANGPFPDLGVLLESGMVDTLQYRQLIRYLSCR